jgi:hypothetical protein
MCPGQQHGVRHSGVRGQRRRLRTWLRLLLLRPRSRKAGALLRPSSSRREGGTAGKGQQRWMQQQQQPGQLQQQQP